MKKVLIAFDNGHFSKGGFEFARRLNELQPILLTGVFLPNVDYNALTYAYGGTMPVVPFIESYDMEEAEQHVHERLRDYKHEICYSSDKNIINGILSFTEKHKIQLIISLPGKHSFLYYLTHKSISDAICRNAREPVMILK